MQAETLNVGVMMFDDEQSEKINDTYGHEPG